MNLLNETIRRLRQHGLTPDDVEWVGSKDGTYSIDWLAFTKIADFDYDSGYGSQKVAQDLTIVGSDWWMDRHEYDGSECWVFHRKPERKHETLTFTSVNADDVDRIGWCPIEEIEEELQEARDNKIGWNAIFHTHPAGTGRNA